MMSLQIDGAFDIVKWNNNPGLLITKLNFKAETWNKFCELIILPTSPEREPLDSFLLWLPAIPTS